MALAGSPSTLGAGRGVQEQRDGIFTRKLAEVNSIVAELESLRHELAVITGRLLEPMPTDPHGAPLNKAMVDTSSIEGKLDGLIRRLSVLRTEYSEIIGTLGQAA